MNREELEKKAKELKVKFDENTSDADLQSAITRAEKELEEKNNDVNYLRERAKYFEEEARKAFEERDNAKKERRSLQNKIKDIEDSIKDSPDPNEFKELKKELTQMKKYKEELDKLAEEEELKQKTEAEKVEIRYQKEFEQFQKKMEESVGQYKEALDLKDKEIEESKNHIKSLRISRLKSEIIEHAAKNKAYNPSQIVKLIQDRFEYDDNLDKFMSYEKDDKGKLKNEYTVEETVKSFLSDPENDNLVSADLKGPGLHTKDGDKTGKRDDTKLKKDGNKYNPKDEDLQKRAEFAGLPVEDYIETLEQKDAKMAKIQERREKSQNRQTL